eukprot:m.163258 g.163258  ORF g.163258 m.163258 type:complete len:76 (+) comp12286_c0_seq1:120-347(+)
MGMEYQMSPTAAMAPKNSLFTINVRMKFMIALRQHTNHTRWVSSVATAASDRDGMTDKMRCSDMGVWRKQRHEAV